jgi:hypothetical protein
MPYERKCLGNSYLSYNDETEQSENKENKLLKDMERELEAR